MPFRVVHGDITKYAADAIVIPANPKPIVGNGVSKQIYHLAGRNRLLAARRTIGALDFGESAITSAFDLKAKYIVHTIAPVCDGGNKGEKEILESYYRSALNCAQEKGCKSIVFPLLAADVFNYPEDEAEALDTCYKFMNDYDMDIMIVMCDKEEIEREKRVYDGLDAYIEENYYGDLNMEAYNRAEREWSLLPAECEERKLLELMRKKLKSKRADERAYNEFIRKQNQKKKKLEYDLSKTYSMAKLIAATTLDDFLAQKSNIPSFSEVLDKFKKKNKVGSYAEICRRANLREDTLSKMRKENINVTRDYLWALAIALKLTMVETEELFNSCGLTTHGRYRLQKAEEDRELAFQHFIEENSYNIDYINDELEKRNMLILGNESVQKKK